MYACPTCNASSITFFRKWLSYPALPGLLCCLRKLLSCAQVFRRTRSGRRRNWDNRFRFSRFRVATTLATYIGTIATMTFYISHWHRTQLEKLPPELVSAS